MKPIIEELKDSLEESGNDYKLKTDDEIIGMLIDFGCGEMEFHSADINRIIVENQRMKELLNIKEI